MSELAVQVTVPFGLLTFTERSLPFRSPAAAANHASTGPSSAATVGLTLGGAASAASEGLDRDSCASTPSVGLSASGRASTTASAQPRVHDGAETRDTGRLAALCLDGGVRRSGTLPRLGADVAREFRMLKILVNWQRPADVAPPERHRTGGRGTGSSAGRAAARDSPAASRASQPVMVLGLLAGSHLTRPRRTHSSDHLLSRVHTP